MYAGVLRRPVIASLVRHGTSPRPLGIVGVALYGYGSPDPKGSSHRPLIIVGVAIVWLRKSGPERVKSRPKVVKSGPEGVKFGPGRVKFGPEEVKLLADWLALGCWLLAAVGRWLLVVGAKSPNKPWR